MLSCFTKMNFFRNLGRFGKLRRVVFWIRSLGDCLHKYFSSCMLFSICWKQNDYPDYLSCPCYWILRQALDKNELSSAPSLSISDVIYFAGAVGWGWLVAAELQKGKNTFVQSCCSLVRMAQYSCVLLTIWFWIHFRLLILKWNEFKHKYYLPSKSASLLLKILCCSYVFSK